MFWQDSARIGSLINDNHQGGLSARLGSLINDKSLGWSISLEHIYYTLGI